MIIERRLLAIFGMLILVGCAGKPPVVTEPTAEQLQQAEQAGYGFIRLPELAKFIHTRDNMILIDARPEPEFRRGHILGSTNFLFPDRSELEPWSAASHGGIDPSTYARQLGADLGIRVVVYAENAASRRGHQAAAWARKLGYKDIRRFIGGLADWQAAGEETRSLVP
ncbi:hypothetical protein K2X85_10880 [bacterium]|nr:hypothetical protein [bacterium]